MKQKTLSLFTKTLIIFGLFGSFSLPHLTSLIPATRAEAGNEIQNWWPVDSVKLEGTQPFKVLVNNLDIKNYTMYWQVDNGKLNKMDDNYTDYPHKEASVDLTSWHWRDNGIYTINFVAKDLSGNTIGQKEVRIYVNYNDVNQVKSESNSIPPVTVIPPTADISIKPVVTPTATPSPTATPVPIQLPTPTPTPTPVVPPMMNISAVESVWWPTNNVVMDGVQPFKATLENVPLNQYKMYWQVDNGQLNEMTDTMTDGAHKEALVDVSTWWWNNKGPYTLNFVAKDLAGKEITHKTLTFTRGTQTPEVSHPSSQVIPTPLPTPTPRVNSSSTTTDNNTPTSSGDTDTISTLSPSNSSNPFAGLTFYVNPQNNAVVQEQEWQASRPADAELMKKIANEPDAKWIGNWNANVYQDVKDYVDKTSAQGSIAVLIAYNIPGRDCGSYSAGGAENAAKYEAWINDFAQGIGNRKAAVILEPDALAGISCLDQAGQASRIKLLKDAVKTLKAHANTAVYIDAGNSNWVSAAEMAPRLVSAGINEADGFSVNVSNYYTTADSIAFGTRLSALVGDKHFVIDTSRNGQGPLGSEWCNPQGRGLGQPATTNTGNPLVDAFMWLKNPGESDGQCNGGPSAGVWWPDYALDLAKKAVF